MSQKTTVDWAGLDFVGFARLATDDSLSKYEKIGFPDSYRMGFEPAIFDDIRAKLSRLNERGLAVLDIGPGCSDLPHMLIDLCREQGHQLFLIDSEEMLRHLPDAPFIDKRPGLFPNAAAVADLKGRVDVINCYSVLHYIFVDANPFDFVDLCLELLRPGGELLIGDIPNACKRRRFLMSDAGVAYHRAFTGTDTTPTVSDSAASPVAIDDAAVMSLVMRARAAGADAYLLPQPAALPMANRREDILIRRP